MSLLKTDQILSISEDENIEVKIILDQTGSELQAIYINGEKLTAVKSFSVTVGGRGSCTYQCERYFPIPFSPIMP